MHDTEIRMKIDQKWLLKLVLLSSVVCTSTVRGVSILDEHTTARLSIVKQQALAAHNAFRKLHHASNLSWNDMLANYAANYASQCEFKHSHGPYGENLAAGYPSVNAAISGWYNERGDYSYSNPGFSYRTGHFTQVVWKSSRQLGCALVECNGKNGTPGNFLVCEYDPPGNVVSVEEEYFSKNVLPG